MKKIKNNGACVLDTVLGFLDSSDTQVSYSFSFYYFQSLNQLTRDI